MILPVPVAQNQFKHVPRQTLQTSTCFGCVSGSFGRGSESPSSQAKARSNVEMPKSAPREPTASESEAMEHVKGCQFPWKKP